VVMVGIDGWYVIVVVEAGCIHGKVLAQTVPCNQEKGGDKEEVGPSR